MSDDRTRYESHQWDATEDDAECIVCGVTWQDCDDYCPELAAVRAYDPPPAEVDLTATSCSCDDLNGPTVCDWCRGKPTDAETMKLFRLVRTWHTRQTDAERDFAAALHQARLEGARGGAYGPGRWHYASFMAGWRHGDKARAVRDQERTSDLRTQMIDRAARWMAHPHEPEQWQRDNAEGLVNDLWAVGGSTFRERYDLLSKIEEIRKLADRLDRDADNMERDWVSRNGARFCANRIREVLDA